MRSLALLMLVLGGMCVISCQQNSSQVHEFTNHLYYTRGKSVIENEEWTDINNGKLIINSDKGLLMPSSDTGDYGAIRTVKGVKAGKVGEAVTVSVNFTFEQVANKRSAEIIRLGLSNGESNIMATMDRISYGDYMFIGSTEYMHGETYHTSEIGFKNDAEVGRSDSLQFNMTLTRISDSLWDMVVVLRNQNPENPTVKYCKQSNLFFKNGDSDLLFGVIQNGASNSKAGVSNRLVSRFEINTKQAIDAPYKYESDISLKDYFLPMEPVSPLVEDGIWGNKNVLPRDTANGLSDPTLKNWCYWDGRIVQDDEGMYHIYGSRWHHSFSHGVGWKEDSKGMHAISDNVMGPYRDLGLLWPNWNNGKGHNVVGLRMHDGRYAAVTSEITQGEVFVSETPNGPFELLGEIQVDLNGFGSGLAFYSFNGHMSNVKIILRSDGRYMLVPRSTCVMISEDGILGPYKIMTDRVYKNTHLPKYRNEDPTVWYSGGMYHIVYNHWPSKTCHHFSSIDGITDWKYRGVAFKKGETKIFSYTDGTVNDWEFIERPTAHVENGHVTHFIFSVIDVHKGADGGNDNHASKIVIVPFDGESFDRDMQALVEKEKLEEVE